MEETNTEKNKPEETNSVNLKTVSAIVLCSIFIYLFLATTWVCDDAFITFRSCDNLVHGYGPVWNTVERVQAFTNPLWMFLVSGVMLFGIHPYYASLAISLAACLVLLILWFRKLQDPLRVFFLFVLVISSKAFMDYTSSGLENPLSYLLLGLFYASFLEGFSGDKELRKADLYFYFLISSLAFFNRMDTLLLYLPAVICLLVKGIRQFRFSVIRIFLIGTLPASLWLIFATLYYGSPFPNTFYSKVGIGVPDSVVFKQGIAYVLNNINFDPITLLTVGLSIALAIYARRLHLILASAGALLYVLYTMKVGGDFMAGRFLAAPFLLAALTIAVIVREQKALIAALGLLVIYSVFAPLSPVKVDPEYDQAWNWRLQNGVHDERGAYHKGTNLLFYDPFKRLRDRDWKVNGMEGMSLRYSDRNAKVEWDVGILGYHAGPDKYVIDVFGHGDPLLARLPASDMFYFEFSIGNPRRDIPEGYLESCETGENRIVDPELREYYDRLLRLTRGPIFDLQRLGDIYEFTFGKYRHFDYRLPGGVIASVPAAHQRFSIYVGVRERGSVRSSGNEGFLQMGPYIPLRPGSYSVEWRGSLESAPPSPYGFVDVCSGNGGTVIARTELTQGENGKRPHVLAVLDFTLDRYAEDVEYRFFVNEGVKLTLNRITLSRVE
jgi:arabinofuranosyltransferase